MALFDNVREPSLSFVSDGVKYQLLRPWTNKDIFELQYNALHIRGMLAPDVWKEWRSKHKKREDANRLAKDSLATVGIDGDKAYELLAILGDDKLFPLIESDLLPHITLEGLIDESIPFRRAVAAFTSLPDTCAYKRKLNEPYFDWDLKEHMLAEIVDLLNYNNQLVHIGAQVNGWKPTANDKAPSPVFKRPEPEKPKVFNALSDLFGATNVGTVNIAHGEDEL